MSTTKRIPWVAAAIFLALLTATFVAAQKSLSPEALYQRANQKEKVDGDTKAAIDLYKQVAAAPGASEKLKSQAKERLDALAARSASPAGTMTDRLLWTVRESRLSSITPDGRWIGTDTRTSGAIRNTSTGEIKLVIDGADGPLISPDGNTIVYNFYGTDSLRPKDSTTGQLRIMGVDTGSKPRVLVSSPEIRYSVPVAWALDGKSVLLVTTKQDGTWQLGWLSVANGSIQVLKSLDWRLNLVTNRKASLSPDGRYIAYSALATNPKTRYSLSSDNDSDAQDIYVISADGMSEKVLTKTGGINDSPVWTPDGSRILFTSDRSGTFDLYSVAMRDGEAAGFPSLVKKDVGRIFPVNTMTKPGTYYYVATPQSEVHIAEMEPRALTFRGHAAGVAESFTGFRPTWSPNGQSIAFTKERAEGHRGNVDLVVQTLKTGAAKVYPSVDMNNVALGQVVSWFHDGKALLLAKNSDTGLALNRIDLNHGEIKEVAGSADFLHNGIGAISADDKTIYVRIANLKIDPNNPGRFAVDISNIDRIVPFTLIPSASVPSELSIGPDGATIRKESREAILSSSNTQRHGFSVPDGVSDLVLSPDGHTLALTSSPDPKTNEVYLACVAAADGSGYRRLYGPFRSDKLGNKIAWTADGRIILFAMSDSNDRWRIMRIPADGGSAEFTGLEVDRLRNFDLSPDGSRIAFEVGANPNWEVRALDYVSSISKTSR